MGGLKNCSEGLLYFWPGNSTSLLWEEDFLLWEASKNSSDRIEFLPGNSTSLLWEEDFLLWEASKNVQKDFIFLAWEQHQFIMGGGFFIMGGLKKCSEGFYIFGLGTAPVYYGRRIFYYGRPQKLFTTTLDYFWPGNSTSLLWEEDFLLWEASKNVQKHFIFLAWEQHQFIMGGGFFIMGGLKKFSQQLLYFWPGNSTSLLWEEDFYYGRPQKLFTITLNYLPGNSTSLLWEEDFLLWEASKTFHNHFELFAWEQHQFIMGGGFFIMGGLKKCSEPFYIFGLGTAPVYYGRRIFYYGRPQKMFRTILYFLPGNSTSLLWEEDFLLWEASKTFHNHFELFGLGTAPVYYGRRIFYYGRPLGKMFRTILYFWPGNSTSLLWEEDFLLWEASKNVQNHFIFLAWEQHQFIMGGGFFIMGGLKNFSQSL